MLGGFRAWKGERGLKAGAEVIDYASGRKSQENFLPAFGEAANCHAEKLHMVVGWACQG